MSFTNQSNRTSAVGSGAVGQEIPFRFPITLTSDLAVKKRVTATSVPINLNEITNYTVVINGTAGGTVTTVTAIETTEQIHIIRNTPFTQELELEQGGAFSAPNVETAFDKTTKLAVENKDLLDNKVLLFPATDPDLTTELPSVADRASKVISCDSLGNITASSAVPAGSVSFTTFGENMAEAANALAGKAVINLDHVIDVRDYGVTGSGDETTEIQAAVTAAAGKTLFFRPGTYTISSTINFGSIKMVGYAATIFLLAGSDTEMLAVDENFTSIIIDGLIFDGNGANQTARKDLFDCLEFDGTELIIRNCIFKNGRDDAGVGRYLSHIDSCDIDKVRILNNTYKDSVSYIGVRFNSDDGSILKDVLIQGCKAEDCTKSLVAFKLTGDATFPYKRVRIIGNDADTFEDDDGIPIEIGNVEQLVISDNTLKDCHAGMTIVDCDNATVTGNSIDGANGSATTSRGIELDSTVTTGVYGHWTIVGNTITNSTMGITLTANSITGGSCTINSNDLSDISFQGILIKEVAKDVLIDGNNILGGLTAASGGGIVFVGDGSGDVANAIITNNKVHIQTSGIPACYQIRLADDVFFSGNKALVDSDATSGAAHRTLRINDVTNLRVTNNTFISKVAGALQGIVVGVEGNVHNLYIDKNHVQGYFLGISTELALGESSNVNVTDNVTLANTTNINTNVGHFRNEILSYENSSVFYENEIVKV